MQGQKDVLNEALFWQGTLPSQSWAALVGAQSGYRFPPEEFFLMVHGTSRLVWIAFTRTFSCMHTRLLHPDRCCTSFRANMGCTGCNPVSKDCTHVPTWPKPATGLCEQGATFKTRDDQLTPKTAPQSHRPACGCSSAAAHACHALREPSATCTSRRENYRHPGTAAKSVIAITFRPEIPPFALPLRNLPTCSAWLHTRCRCIGHLLAGLVGSRPLLSHITLLTSDRPQTRCKK